MKKLILLSSIILVSFISCKDDKTKQTSPEEAEVKTTKEVESKPVQESKSILVWEGYKPGESHKGTIDIQSTDLKFENTKLVGGTIIVDMNTITNSDVKSAEHNTKLVNHLKNEDFFEVDKYPTSKFEMTSVKYLTADHLEIEGDLTIRGITKKINFPAFVVLVNGQKTLKSKTIKIDRTEFGVEYKSKKIFKTLKDKFIYDEFDIAFKIILK